MHEVKHIALWHGDVEMTTLNIHSVLQRSEANGPGVRSVVWFQGCHIRCPGCWNPDTHQSDGGNLIRVQELLQRLLLIESDGVTLTGGEPLDQLDGCIELARRLRFAGKSVVLFTGYTRTETMARAAIDVLHECFDTILAGPYNRALGETKDLGILRDKMIWHLSNRYVDDDFLSLPEAEVIISGDQIVFTGLGLPSRRKDRSLSGQ